MRDSSRAPTNPPDGGHTIAVVAERTGLSRDVLRVWERRYQAVQPARTTGRQRLYSDAELSRFLLLARANRGGRSIGSIARLTTEQLQQMVATDLDVHILERESDVKEESAHAKSIERTVRAAMVHVAVLDGSALNGELRLALARFGLPVLLGSIVPALMKRVGDDWMEQRIGIAHEHLASAVVLGILLEAMQSLPGRPGAPRLVVATPAGENHVLGAALIAAAAAMDGWKVQFLGADVPSQDLTEAAVGARAVALSLVFSADQMHVVDEVRAVRAALPSTVPLVLGGPVAVRLGTKLALTGAIVCQHIEEARAILEKLL